MKFKTKLRLIPFLACLFVGILPLKSEAQQQYISVGQAKARKSILAFPEIRLPDGATSPAIPASKKISETFLSDIAFTDLFKVMGSAAYIEKKETSGIVPGSFKMSDWTSIGSEFLVKSALTSDKGNLTLEAYLYETATGKTVLAKKYVGVAQDARLIGHHLATDVLQSLTGQPGVFFSKIAMVCDRGGKQKEVYLMDFDGSNVKQLTQHRSIILGPAWNTDGTKLAYSAYTKRKDNLRNLDLFEFDFKTGLIRVISNRKGTNSGASYSPKDGTLAMTMSFLGNPEIFSFDPITKGVTRLTHSMGTDVDPAWSPDGKKLAFVSSRTGAAMVFSMNADGSDVKRLTFAGQYNATPNWSPDGKKLVFAGWISGRFDIFTMNSDGSVIERLTKDQGNNEDPSYSPDGNAIVFSSNRAGQKNIYVMNTDGSFVKRLTFGLGNCVSPRWVNSIPQLIQK